VRSGPCVVPVAAADALAWAVGRLSDAELLLRTRFVPEAVFLVNLPDLASYRECLRQCNYWRQRGAVFMVTRTGNAVVDDHIILKNRGRETYREPFQGQATQYRFVLPPDGFNFWLNKISRRAPDPALTAGTPPQPRRGEIPFPPMSQDTGHPIKTPYKPARREI
jgi:hypothetical protein